MDIDEKLSQTDAFFEEILSMDALDETFDNKLKQILESEGVSINDVQQRDDPLTQRAFEEVLNDEVNRRIDLINTKSESLVEDFSLIRELTGKAILSLWQRPIQLLEVFILLSLHLGKKINQDERPRAYTDQDITFEVLLRQQGRACQIAWEILTLLRNGFPDGGLARFRTLYEISIISMFIEKFGADAAQRYVDFEIVESWKAQGQFNKYAEMLGYEKYSENETIALKKEYKRICQKYGDQFGQPYGWASPEIAEKWPGKTRFTFADLQDIVGMDHMKPYYKMASFPIHGDIKGLLYRLPENDKSCIPNGPSLFNLGDTGACTAISLLNVNITLLSILPIKGQMNSVFFMLNQVCKEIVDSFIDTQVMLDKKST